MDFRRTDGDTNPSPQKKQTKTKTKTKNPQNKPTTKNPEKTCLNVCNYKFIQHVHAPVEYVAPEPEI